MACPNATDVAPTPLPVVVDNCGATLTPTGPVISTKPVCEGTRTYTYLYTDCENNTQDWVYTYTVEREPFINPVDAGITVACPNATDVAPTPLPVVVDNCGGTLTPTGPVISTKPVCEGTRTYTYLYTDCENNTQDWVYTYTVEREPFINPVDAGITVACPNATDVAPTPLPVVVDNCGATLTPTGPVISTKPVCEGTRTYTYLYTDCENNTQDWVYTYTVEREPFINPVDAGITVACPNATDVAPTPLPVVVDNCGGTLTPTGPVISTKPVCEGTRTYTYLYTDCENNTQDWVYTYTVEREPFNNPVDAGITVACPNATDVAPTPLPVVVDNCGATLTPTGPVISTKPVCEGTRTYTYLYTDCENNTQDWVYTYTVEREPFNNPVDAGTTVACPNATDVAPTPLPVVVDNCGGTLTPTGPVISTKPVCEGTRTYTYLYTDCEGNTQDWVYTYTVEREPFNNPVDAGTTVACPNATDVAPTPLPVVVDNCGGTLTPTGPVISTKPVCEGTRTYTYLYTDCEGNTQDWVYTYTVEREPFINPVDAGTTVACPNATDVAPTPLPVVVDNCGGTLTPTGPVISTKPVCEGTRTYTYLYTDCEGNTQDWVYTYTVEREPFNNPVDAGTTVACPNATDVAPTPLPVVVDNCGGYTYTNRTSHQYEAGL